MPGRKDRLVREHLENVAGDVLGDYPKIIESLAGGRNGIYALYRGDRLYYVGLATDLRLRLKQHLRDRLSNKWDRFSVYVTADDRHLHEIEALILRIGKPRGNRTRPRLPGSQSLGPELRRLVRERQRQQADHIIGRTAGKGGGPQRDRGKRRSTRLPLSQSVKRQRNIRLVHEGKTHVAKVHPDGTIHYRGREFTSPSGAAGAIMGVSVNGWRVWEYQRRPGKWAPLRRLREESSK